MIFRKLIRLGSFSECWRSANVIAVPKAAPTADRENYRPISITYILSKMYEKFVSHRLSSCCSKYGSLLPVQSAYMKGLDWTDALLTLSDHLQKSLDAGMESHII